MIPAFVWLLILAGPFLAVLPAVVAAAPQIPGFFGTHTAPARPSGPRPTRPRPVRMAVRFA